MVLIRVTASFRGGGMGSENPSGADNQQETAIPAGSSETAREALRSMKSPSSAGTAIEGEDTVRPPWRHGEPGRNDLAAHEMNSKSATSRSE